MEYIAIYRETLALVKRYSEAQRCRLYEAMANYAFDNVLPNWPDDAIEWFGWEALKQQVDRARSKSDQAKANGSKPKRKEASGSKAKQNEAESPKEKEKEKDKETEKDIYTTPTTRTCETAFGTVEVDELQNYAQQYLTGLTSTHLEELSDYENILNTQLVEHAIDEAVANSVRSWSYVRAILQGYIKSGIRTVAQAEQAKESHKKATASHGRQVTAQQYEQREYTEQELEARTADILNEALGVRT